jgi:hypothetical protein
MKDVRLQSRILLACQWITLADAIVLLIIPRHRLRSSKLPRQASGIPRSADTCVAMSQVIADNDTRGPKNAIKRQNGFLGNVANGIAELFPDLGHVIKNSSNEFFSTRDKDSSFKGKQCLTNEKIKSIHSDMCQTVKDYCNYVGNEDDQTKCLRQLNCIVCHPCGNHSKCFQVHFCTYIQVKN